MSESESQADPSVDEGAAQEESKPEAESSSLSEDELKAKLAEFEKIVIEDSDTEKQGYYKEAQERLKWKIGKEYIGIMLSASTAAFSGIEALSGIKYLINAKDNIQTLSFCVRSGFGMASGGQIGYEMGEKRAHARFLAKLGGETRKFLDSKVDNEGQIIPGAAVSDEELQTIADLIGEQLVAHQRGLHLDKIRAKVESPKEDSPTGGKESEKTKSRFQEYRLLLKETRRNPEAKKIISKTLIRTAVYSSLAAASVLNPSFLVIAGGVNMAERYMRIRQLRQQRRDVSTQYWSISSSNPEEEHLEKETQLAQLLELYHSRVIGQDETETDQELTITELLEKVSISKNAARRILEEEIQKSGRKGAIAGVSLMAVTSAISALISHHHQVKDSRQAESQGVSRQPSVASSQEGITDGTQPIQPKPHTTTEQPTGTVDKPKNFFTRNTEEWNKRMSPAPGHVQTVEPAQPPAAGPTIPPEIEVKDAMESSLTPGGLQSPHTETIGPSNASQEELAPYDPRLGGSSLSDIFGEPATGQEVMNNEKITWEHNGEKFNMEGITQDGQYFIVGDDKYEIHTTPDGEHQYIEVLRDQDGDGVITKADLINGVPVKDRIDIQTGRSPDGSYAAFDKDLFFNQHNQPGDQDIQRENIKLVSSDRARVDSLGISIGKNTDGMLNITHDSSGEKLAINPAGFKVYEGDNEIKLDKLDKPLFEYQWQLDHLKVNPDASDPYEDLARQFSLLDARNYTFENNIATHYNPSSEPWFADFLRGEADNDASLKNSIEHDGILLLGNDAVDNFWQSKPEAPAGGTGPQKIIGQVKASFLTTLKKLLRLGEQMDAEVKKIFSNVVQQETPAIFVTTLDNGEKGLEFSLTNQGVAGPSTAQVALDEIPDSVRSIISRGTELK